MTALVVLLAMLAQEPDQVFRVGGDVTAPQVKHKVDPKYSGEARLAGVQGTALYTLIVDTTGHPKNIEIISPIGYGLDEKGLEAIRQWVFVPGMKKGKPVNIRAQIEINFRFVGQPFNDKFEKQRTRYNSAIRLLKTSDREQKGVEEIFALSKEEFPAAITLVGAWMQRGDHGPKDDAAAKLLFQKAAAKNYGPAITQIALLEEATNPEQALRDTRRAAALGSEGAQLALADRYENGRGVEKSMEEARTFYRLCAATGVGLCQFRLGRLLTDDVQSVAWLQLAAEQKQNGAAELATERNARLTPEQLKQVEKLKPQLVRHPL
jgi:TonB family protein